MDPLQLSVGCFTVQVSVIDGDPQVVDLWNKADKSSQNIQLKENCSLTSGLIKAEIKKEVWAHRVFPSDGKSLDDSFLDVAAGTGDAISGERLLFLPLSHAVRQEINLDCDAAHTLLDLPVSVGGGQRIATRLPQRPVYEMIKNRNVHYYFVK